VKRVVEAFTVYGWGAVTRRRRGRPCLKRHFRFREVPNNKMEGKNNLDDLDARLQVLEKRVHGERGGKNNKPVKVILLRHA